MLNLVANREFYETFDRYEPNEDEYLKVVKNLLSENWGFHRNGTWFGAAPPDRDSLGLPSQGWKIHISSCVANAEEILEAIVPVLRDDNTSFKFAMDKFILTMMNGKAYGRQGAGKFVTIYPTDDNHFKELIEKIHQVTKQFKGLYILSDRRYKDSKVVFYRYGGILPISTLDVTGRKVSKIISPDGEPVSDVRQPYFHVPAWTKDPFEANSKETVDPAQLTLKDGRYLIKSALGHSNSGGVYIAEDKTTGQTVVVKEARPYVSSAENSLGLLEKEHRILLKLMHTNLVPKVIDFFQDWEHSFLVMERVEGASLSTFATRHNITLKTAPSIEDSRTVYNYFKTIFLQLAKILKTMHENRIVFTDFSPNNILVNFDTLDVKIIDFEAAYEIGVDAPVSLFTPGFTAPHQLAGQPSSFESDYFALGATMHYFLSPVNQIFAIHPKARYTFVKSVINDIGFPESLYVLISELIDKEPEKRPTPEKVIEFLEKEEEIKAPNFRFDKAEVEATYHKLVKTVPRYILANADYSRPDRLFPADYAIFATNPLNIAYGACGVAYAINKMEGGVPDSVTDWLLARNKNPELYPPGLYVGLAGIAWSFLELGLIEPAQEIMKSTFNHRLLYDSMDLYYGIAGWGMANLKFFTELQNEIYLQKAIEAGDFLIKNLSKDEKGYYFETESGIPLGLHHGASGVSLFLLYLYLASKKEIYLDVGRQTLDFDINNASPNIEGGISWKRYVDQGRIVYPYLGQGSAGVGVAIARYYRLLSSGDEKYGEMLEKIYHDTNRKYAVFPGVFSGLSGIGEFLLDLYGVTNQENHLEAAYRIAAGVSLFIIEKEEGVAFPGDELKRISCDFGTGSAGIGLFLHRLVHRGESHFKLDELFVAKKTGIAAGSII